MKKHILIFIINILFCHVFLFAQDKKKADERMRDIYILIDNYAQAREKKDTALLKNILTNDVDQLVSSGEWRNGIKEAIQGMMQSSGNNPGTRKLTVEKIRFLDAENAIADARYEIKSKEGDTRKMWSTFVVVNINGQWKIAAIRNMLPSGQP
jgi:uncharacterized protein (TIGR02246 family)